MLPLLLLLLARLVLRCCLPAASLPVVNSASTAFRPVCPRTQVSS